MGKEIERKFLVDKEKLHLPDCGKKLIQAYLWNNPEKSLRIRIAADLAFLTIKTGTNVLDRLEFEYEIPMEDARELLAMCDAKIEKTRYLIEHKNHTWEVDVFHGSNDGLIIAEVELNHANESIDFPSWIDKEVSHDPKYLNASLIKKPFLDW